MSEEVKEKTLLTKLIEIDERNKHGVDAVRTNARAHAQAAITAVGLGKLAEAMTQATIAAMQDEAWAPLRREIEDAYYLKAHLFIAFSPSRVLVLRLYPGDNVDAVARRYGAHPYGVPGRDSDLFFTGPNREERAIAIAETLAEKRRADVYQEHPQNALGRVVSYETLAERRELARGE